MKIKKNNKKIGVSNYIIVIAIMIVSMFSIILLRNLYVTREENKLNIPVLRDVLMHELTASEVNNYINENPDVVMYISVSKDKECRSFEEDIKSYLIDNNLGNDIVYVNLNSDEVDSFFNSFNNALDNENKLNEYPAFVSIKNGKVEDILSGSVYKEVLSDFLDEVGLDNND